MNWTKKATMALLTIVITVALGLASAQAQQKPNFVIIWGDDIGQSDISAYSHGLMGFQDA